MTETTAIYCNGKSEDKTKHPLVYLKIPKNKEYVNCPYCNLRFTKE